MKSIRMMSTVAALVAFGAFGAACEADVDTEDTFPGAETATEEPAISPAPPTGTGSAAAMIRVANLPDAGAYITDANGRALYLLEGEPEGTSTCYDECAEEWPPLIVDDGSPAADDDAVRPDLIGTIERRDGRTQATYDGHALYYYHDDQGSGDTTGQDVTDEWGEWYLVQPSGEALESESND